MVERPSPRSRRARRVKRAATVRSGTGQLGVGSNRPGLDDAAAVDGSSSAAHQQQCQTDFSPYGYPQSTPPDVSVSAATLYNPFSTLSLDLQGRITDLVRQTLLRHDLADGESPQPILNSEWRDTITEVALSDNDRVALEGVIQNWDYRMAEYLVQQALNPPVPPPPSQMNLPRSLSWSSDWPGYMSQWDAGSRNAEMFGHGSHAPDITVPVTESVLGYWPLYPTTVSSYSDAEQAHGHWLPAVHTADAAPKPPDPDTTNPSLLLRQDSHEAHSRLQHVASPVHGDGGIYSTQPEALGHVSYPRHTRFDDHGRPILPKHTLHYVLAGDDLPSSSSSDDTFQGNEVASSDSESTSDTSVVQGVVVSGQKDNSAPLEAQAQSTTLSRLNHRGNAPRSEDIYRWPVASDLLVSSYTPVASMCHATRLAADLVVEDQDLWHPLYDAAEDLSDESTPSPQSPQSAIKVKLNESVSVGEQSPGGGGAMVPDQQPVSSGVKTIPLSQSDGKPDIQTDGHLCRTPPSNDKGRLSRIAHDGWDRIDATATPTTDTADTKQLKSSQGDRKVSMKHSPTPSPGDSNGRNIKIVSKSHGAMSVNRFLYNQVTHKGPPLHDEDYDSEELMERADGSATQHHRQPDPLAVMPVHAVEFVHRFMLETIRTVMFNVYAARPAAPKVVRDRWGPISWEAVLGAAALTVPPQVLAATESRVRNLLGTQSSSRLQPGELVRLAYAGEPDSMHDFRGRRRRRRRKSSGETDAQTIAASFKTSERGAGSLLTSSSGTTPSDDDSINSGDDSIRSLTRVAMSQDGGSAHKQKPRLSGEKAQGHFTRRKKEARLQKEKRMRRLARWIGLKMTARNDELRCLVSEAQGHRQSSPQDLESHHKRELPLSQYEEQVYDHGLFKGIGGTRYEDGADSPHKIAAALSTTKQPLRWIGNHWETLGQTKARRGLRRLGFVLEVPDTDTSSGEGTSLSSHENSSEDDESFSDFSIFSSYEYDASASDSECCPDESTPQPVHRGPGRPRKHAASNSTFSEPPPKRRRGRPKKSSACAADEVSNPVNGLGPQSSTHSLGGDPVPPKRPRGRPRKSIPCSTATTVWGLNTDAASGGASSALPSITIRRTRQSARKEAAQS